MKVKDYFVKVKRQTKIGGEDIDKFIESIPDFEMPDVVNNLLEENLLTRERASADKDILKRIKAEVYNGVDANIAELIPGLPKADQDAISEEKDTHKKIKMLDAAYKKQHDELKKSSPDSDAINKENQKTIKELKERLESSKSDHDAAVKKILSEHASEKKNDRVRNDLVSKIGQLELAKEYTGPKIKDVVYQSILGEILKNDLDYDESGQLTVQEIVNGVAKPKFFTGTNDLVTVDKLIETHSADYIKKNNADPGGGNTTPKTIPPSAPKTGMTLRQMQAAAASE